MVLWQIDSYMLYIYIVDKKISQIKELPNIWMNQHPLTYHPLNVHYDLIVDI
jgi:hypothetical protein